MSWALALALALHGAQGTAARTLTIEPGFEIAGHRVADLDADGRSEFVVVACDGRVRSFRPLSDEPGRALGELVLPTPERTLLELADFGARTFLVAATPEGTRAYPVDERGLIGAEGDTWIPRARFTLRVQAPTFASIVQDVNHDGLNDVLLPTLAGIELWLAQREPDQARPSFRKAATLAVEIARSAEHEFTALSDALAHSVTIPGLDTADVNGDGRPDLLVVQDGRRAWHLQREDASFPLAADVELDLSIFQDTTPAASTRFGGTLSPGEGARCASRDLDGDSVPDYVISHRRKVWVFRGGPAGPQFTEPSAILKTAEDVTLLLVHRLDPDPLADLLLVKVQIPTLATLLGGLFGEWDVAIRALGYRNVGAGKFETSPSLTNDLALRLPGIVGLMKNPEELSERFEELEKRFRGGARGDVDGDGAEDTLLVTPDAHGLELWLGEQGAPTDAGDESWLQKLLFGEPDAVWDVERALTAMGTLAERQVARATGGRAADQSFPLRDPAACKLRSIECADFDADGACEIVIPWQSLEDPRRGWFDVLVLAGE